MEGRVRAALGVGSQDDLTCDLLSGLTGLSIGENGFPTRSVVGVQNLTGLLDLTLVESPWIAGDFSDISPLSGLTSLTSLHLDARSISDIGPLSGLTSLTTLTLGGRSITDMSPLSGLTSLTYFWLRWSGITDFGALGGLTSLRELRITSARFVSSSTIHQGSPEITDISMLSGLTSLTHLDLRRHSISDLSALGGLTSLTDLNLEGNPDLSDIQPLLDNTGLGPGDTVSLAGTVVSCADVAALKDKGVSVSSDCS